MAERPPKRRAGRPPVLSRELLVATAVDAGVEGLTVRGLAQRLGVAHSALYRWVRNRDALLDLVSDALLARVGASLDDTAEWRAWLVGFAWGLRREFRPVMSGSVLAQFPRTTEEYAVLRRRAEAVLTAGGVAPAAAAETYEVFVLSVWGWLAVEHACPDQIDHERHFAVMLDVVVRGLPATAPVGAPQPR